MHSSAVVIDAQTLQSVRFLVLLILNVLGRRKVHYVLPEGKEMVEEYDMQNGKLLGVVCGVCVCAVQCSADTSRAILQASLVLPPLYLPPFPHLSVTV